ISIDSEHLTKTIRRNFPSDRRTFLESVLQDPDEPDPPTGSIIATARKPVEAVIELEGSKAGDTNGMEDTKGGRTRLALVSTIQFAAALNKLKEDLSVPYRIDNDARPPPSLLADAETANGSPSVVQYNSRVDLDPGSYELTVPRSKPLSPGEILGCTAPRLKDVDAILQDRYLADGRFHLEAIMIANPDLPAFRYDPYSKKLTRERYDHHEMRLLRGNAVKEAKETLPDLLGRHEVVSNVNYQELEPNPQVWGVVLGTLGRQGSLRQMEAILRQLETYGCRTCSVPSLAPVTPSHIPYMPILLSELSPAKLALFNQGSEKDGHITTFVQTSCPRLSIDWGYAFDKPLLNPYEAAIALGLARSWEETDELKEVESQPLAPQPRGVYPMDFYETGSVWA
ncbi:Diphthamide biosynthesis protein 1, partial [Serendipita sp. 399]